MCVNRNYSLQINKSKQIAYWVLPGLSQILFCDEINQSEWYQEKKKASYLYGRYSFHHNDRGRHKTKVEKRNLIAKSLFSSLLFRSILLACYVFVYSTNYTRQSLLDAYMPNQSHIFPLTKFLPLCIKRKTQCTGIVQVVDPY
jgi:hypothetical protein